MKLVSTILFTTYISAAPIAKPNAMSNGMGIFLGASALTGATIAAVNGVQKDRIKFAANSDTNVAKATIAQMQAQIADQQTIIAANEERIADLRISAIPPIAPLGPVGPVGTTVETVTSTTNGILPPLPPPIIITPTYGVPPPPLPPAYGVPPPPMAGPIAGPIVGPPPIVPYKNGFY